CEPQAHHSGDGGGDQHATPAPPGASRGQRYDVGVGGSVPGTGFRRCRGGLSYEVALLGGEVGEDAVETGGDGGGHRRPGQIGEQRTDLGLVGLVGLVVVVLVVLVVLVHVAHLPAPSSVRAVGDPTSRGGGGFRDRQS